MVLVVEKCSFEYIKRFFENEVVYYETSSRKMHYGRPENATLKNTLSIDTFFSGAPLRVYFDPTYRCNLRCRHCITSSSPDAAMADELDLPGIKQLAEELASIGVFEITITGGEPFIHPDIFEIIRCIQDSGLNLTIASNGTLITPQKAEKLSELGVQDIRISIDGHEAVNDSIRGKGTYKRAMEGVQNLVQAKVPVSVRTTLTKNVNDGLEYLFMDLNKAGVDNLKAAVIKEAGNAILEKNSDLLGYRPDEETMQYLLSLGEKNGITVELSSDDFDFGTAMAGDRKLRKKGHNTCGAGFETAYISPTGEMLICSSMPRASLGNIRNCGFMDVWKGHVAENYRAQALASGEKKICTVKFVNIRTIDTAAEPVSQNLTAMLPE